MANRKVGIRVKIFRLGVREVWCPLTHKDLHRGHKCSKCKAQV